jgi:glutathione S-transferase
LASQQSRTSCYLSPGRNVHSPISWLFAAHNTIEPHFSTLAELDFFTTDEDIKTKRRPAVIEMINMRLGQLETALGLRQFLVDNGFTIADLMMSSVFKITHHTNVFDSYPSLLEFQNRCFERSAYKQAIADRCNAFSKHTAQNMKYHRRTNQ